LTTTSQPGAVWITLTGTDTIDDTLTYVVVVGPKQGALSATAGLMTAVGTEGWSIGVTYTPNITWHGMDSFSYEVSDGTNTSAVVWTSIWVVDTMVPQAMSQAQTTNVNKALVLTLTGTDTAGNALTFVIVTQPANGSVTSPVYYTAWSAKVTYTPGANWWGTDSFVFYASDGTNTGWSAGGVASLAVVDNGKPTVQGQTVTLAMNAVTTITLSGTDTVGATLVFAIVSGPTRGTLSAPTNIGAGSAYVT
jgi:hypothetical protein